MKTRLLITFFAFFFIAMPAPSGLWDNQPDTRRRPTNAEIKKYSASGRIVYKKIPWGDKFSQHNHAVGSAFAMRCPDGTNDVLVTNSHALREYNDQWKQRRSEGKWFDLPPSQLGFDPHDIEYPVTSLKNSLIDYGWVLPDDSWDPVYEKDWAVIRVQKPMGSNVHDFGHESRMRPDQCVRMIAWFQPGNISQEPYRRIQTCKITDVYYQRGVKLLEHNCQTIGGTSGSALLDCATDKVLGLHAGEGVEKSSQYGVGDRRFQTGKNYNLAIAMTGNLKVAILKMCRK